MCQCPYGNRGASWVRSDKKTPMDTPLAFSSKAVQAFKPKAFRDPCKADQEPERLLDK
jgi:hypothetical protein